MKSNKISYFPFFIVLSIFQACVSHTRPLSIENNYTTQSFPIEDSLFPKASIDFTPFEVAPAYCYKQEFQIKDTFSLLEKHRVGVTDYNLFIHHTDFFVNLENTEENHFHFPLVGARVLSKFGPRNGRQHKGIDLKINRRDTVKAVFDGIVRLAIWMQGYGNVIVVRHYNGLETVYAHNSKHFVRSGDHVKAGTPISLTGATGRATTDHLHFEIRVNGIPINPQHVIDFETQSLLPKRLVFSLDKKGKLKIETV